jgi:alkylation response protein AidB-like acyl-CoA dehydrogenase
MPEVLGPAIEQFAAPELAARVLPAMLRGEEQWCQGFSEPDAGSDLGSMRTTGTVDGDAWVVSGQKLWTSWAQYASRCVLLARTGPPDSGSRGITAFFVDMDSPGITVRPLRTMAGIDEFCETFFDQVRIPSDRVIGAVDDGWRVAQHILACERGAIFWQRAGWLLHHLDEIVQDPAADDEVSARVIGHAYADVFAFRSCSRSTQAQVAIGDLRAAETSVDKILIAKADQAVFDACRQVLDGAIELDDSTAADRFRKEWIYSRAATIYGGTSEIQREIVASRLLKMPRTT